MYYITKKDSETGKKFALIVEKIKKANSAALEIVKELGADAHRPSNSPWISHGGISSFVFYHEPENKSIWKIIGKNEYFISKKTKEGTALLRRIKILPIVEIDELNKCIGMETMSDSHWRSIGFHADDDEKIKFFGFKLKEEWKINVPADCTEVTTKNFNKIFNIKK